MRRWLFALALSASPAQAFDFQVVGGTEVARDESPASSVRLPREVWRPGVVYAETEGGVRRSVFRVSNPTMTTLQLADPFRSELEAAGYSEVLGCADRACGGFDFRFQLDLLPPPAMYVDLGNYRYLLMERTDADPKFVSVVTSASATAGYIHVTEVFEKTSPDVVAIPESGPNVPASDGGLIDELIKTGHVVLEDLEFDTGSAELGPAAFPSLQVLADWLSRTPGARVVLVGHTDSVGSLEANLNLSRRRASSVLNRLVERLGVAEAQVASDGAGALSPIASNLTEAGRALNRRVEVVLLGIE